MIDRLMGKIRETGNPTVVGLDPRLNMIPEYIKEEAYTQYGKTPEGAAEAFSVSTRRSLTRSMI